MSAIVAAAILVVALSMKQRAALLREQLDQQKAFKTVEILQPYMSGLVLPLKATRRLSADRFYLSGLTDDERADRDEITRFLNAMEYLSLLINLKIVDDGICKRLVKTLTVSSFKALLSYVLQIRNASRNSKIYREYESLARLWEGLDDQPAGMERADDGNTAKES